MSIQKASVRPGEQYRESEMELQKHSEEKVQK